jgi:7-cyano-7-deazaguanine synthase
MKDNKKVLVLFSGGIDSSSVIHYYKILGFKIYGLFINYGQKAYQKEREAVKKLSSYFSIETIYINLQTNFTDSNGVIQGRNYYFISSALMNLPFHKGLISLGIHKGTMFPDCSSYFIQKNQEIINLYHNGNVLIDCPFINMHKQDIIYYFQNTNIPFEYTYSCENGSEQPCDNCIKCFELKKMYES